MANVYSIKVTFKNGIVTIFNDVVTHEEKDGKLYIKNVRELNFPLDSVESIEKVYTREDE